MVLSELYCRPLVVSLLRHINEMLTSSPTMKPFAAELSHALLIGGPLTFPIISSC